MAAELHRVCTENMSEGRKGGKYSKQQRLAKMERRHFDLYTEEDVEEANGPLHGVSYQTVDPSTAQERKEKQPHSTWQAFHHLRHDCSAELKQGEGMLRRWPCRQSCCFDLGIEDAVRREVAQSLRPPE